MQDEFLKKQVSHTRLIQRNTAIQKRRNAFFQNNTVNNNSFSEEYLLLRTCVLLNIVCQFSSVSFLVSYFSSERRSDYNFNNFGRKGNRQLPNQREPPAYLSDLMSNSRNPNYKHFEGRFTSSNFEISSSFFH